MLKKKCLTCNKEFYKSSSKSIRAWNEKVKYCSRECSQTIFRKGVIPWNKGKKGVMPPAWNKGKHIYMGGKRFEKGHSAPKTAFKKGFVPWNKGKSWDEQMRIKMSAIHQGIKLKDWKGFSANERKRAMNSKDYILWRTAVFMRDNYTCGKCKERGKNLHADHIKPWALYPELRYAIDNGRTLCEDCHRKTETWGYKTRRLFSDEASGR